MSATGFTFFDSFIVTLCSLALEVVRATRGRWDDTVISENGDGAIGGGFRESVDRHRLPLPKRIVGLSTPSSEDLLICGTGM